MMDVVIQNGFRLNSFYRAMHLVQSTVAV